MKKTPSKSAVGTISADDADCIADVSNGLIGVRALLGSLALSLETDNVDDADDLALRLETAKNAAWALGDLLEKHQQNLSEFYNRILLPHVASHEAGLDVFAAIAPPNAAN
jgi:hypothetical protein